MKRIFTFLSCASFALIFAGCTASSVDEESVGTVGVYRTVGAEIEELTRTSMPDFESGSVGRLVWSEDDAIGLVTSDGMIRKAVIRSEYVGQPYAEFDVSGAVDGDEYIYAFYPYQYYNASSSTATYADGILSFTLPHKQFFIHKDGALVEGGTFQTRMNTMVAKPDENGKMHFKSLCGIIEVRLLGEAGSNLFNVTLQSDSSELSGAASVDLTAEEPAITMGTTNKSFHYTFMQGSDLANKGVKLNAEKPVSFFFVVPAGTYDDLRIAISSIGGGRSVGTTKVSTRPHEVKRNVILALPPYDVETLDAELYTEGKYIDLCRDESGQEAYSNCYLVKPTDTPQAYRIKACFNDGTTVLKYPDGTAAYTPGNQNLAVCAWESENGMVSHIRRDGTYIYFTLSGKPGNAYLQTLGTNMSGIMGWHIWVSDAEEQTLPGENGGHVFMDRNLGALYSPASLDDAEAMTDEQKLGTAGLLYQWGNPSPKEGENLNHYTTNTKTGWPDNMRVLHKWANGEYGQTWNVSSSTEASLANPFTFPNYFYNQSGCWANGREELFGAKALWQSEKTQFDPCPIGYRVASRVEFGQAFTNSIGAPYNGKTYTHSVTAQGSYITLNDSFVFIPWAGFRTCGGSMRNIYSNRYPRVHYWFFDEAYTSATMSGTKILYGYTGGGGDIAKDKVTAEMDLKTYKFFYLTAGTVNPGTPTAGNLYLYADRAFISNGFSLRCVKIK